MCELVKAGRQAGPGGSERARARRRVLRLEMYVHTCIMHMCDEPVSGSDGASQCRPETGIVNVGFHPESVCVSLGSIVVYSGRHHRPYRPELVSPSTEPLTGPERVRAGGWLVRRHRARARRGGTVKI